MKLLCSPALALAAAVLMSACAEQGAQSVCGEGGTGFTAQVSPLGGADIPAVFAELGSVYVVVDPSCRFAVFDAAAAYQGEAVEGQLTNEQAAELTAFLGLEEWESFEPAYGLAMSDGSSTRFAWSARSLDINYSCGGALSAEPPPAFLVEVPSEVASRLRPIGQPSSGSVRYSLGLGDESSLGDPAFEGAPEWPLDIPPEEVIANQATERTAQGAEGDDALALRALRTAFLDGEFGTPGGSFIPIEEPDGSRYALHVRDVVEFERDGAPFVPWANLACP